MPRRELDIGASHVEQGGLTIWHTVSGTSDRRKMYWLLTAKCKLEGLVLLLPNNLHPGSAWLDGFEQPPYTQTVTEKTQRP